MQAERTVFQLRGFNSPVVIVGRHSDPAARWIVPASLPWACARAVRADNLILVGCVKCGEPIEEDNESEDVCFACQGAPEL